jgi:putative DNA primase/helicase
MNISIQPDPTKASESTGESAEITTAWRDRAPELAAWSLVRLPSRADAHGGYKNRHGDRSTGTTRKGGFSQELRVRHFSARGPDDVRGVYPFNEKLECHFVLWDADNHESSDEKAKANLDTMLAIHDRLVGMGLHPMLEDSDGQGSLHLWEFLNQPMALAAAHAFAKHIAGDHGIEHFPKQPKPGPKGLGNFVRVLGRHHTYNHWSRIYDRQHGQWLAGDAAITEILSHTGDDPAIVCANTPAPQIRRQQKRTDGHPQFNGEKKWIDDAVRQSRSGNRNDIGLWLAVQLRDNRIGRAQAESAMREYVKQVPAGDHPYTEAEAMASLEQAFSTSPREPAKKVGGSRSPSNAQTHVGQDEPDAGDQPLILDPKDPTAIAREFLRRNYLHRDGATVLFTDSLYAWNGSCHCELKNAAMRSQVYLFLEGAQRYENHGESMELVPFRPNKAIVDNVVDAIEGLVFTAAIPPCWLSDGPGLPDPKELVVANNGIVHLRMDGQPIIIGPPTPRLFTLNALDFDFLADATPPTEWLKFMGTIWPEDAQAVSSLQEWFGYCLTGWVDLQKALLLVGPKRAGKGTIARILTRLIGMSNVCGPTLSSLSQNFGLWPFIGKLLAVISDARLSGRADQAIVVERILSLTGEDALTIDRKNREPVTARLLARLMLLSNELPRLADPSGALASRFIILTLRQSFYGKEDIGLEKRLSKELPAILLWSIEGWKRLKQRGYFVQPDSSREAIDDLNDLSSPIAAFLRDWCKVQAGASTPVADLFCAWQAWCSEQGRHDSGSQQVFGRDLRAAVPGITTSQTRCEDGRHRIYQGITLTESGKMSMQVWRAARTGTRDSAW